MKKNIKKVKKFKKALMCLIGILILLVGISIGKLMNTSADEITYEYHSNNIGYDSTNNGLTATNVKDAIDELYSKVGKCPSGYECFTDEEVNSSNVSHATIISAYIYNENSCVTGEEEFCKKTLCYLSKNKNSCPSGTIIDYKVNNTETVRFHVLHDNGTTLTLQSQKNTVYNTAWQTSGYHRDGPVTIMVALKVATNGWNNVKDIILEDGMTEFNDGTSADNNCTDASCKPYTAGDTGYSYSKLANNALLGITVKARMITITETAALGCVRNVDESCPIYLSNYLRASESKCRVDGKCINDTHTENGASYNSGYWTMSAYASIEDSARTIYYGGSVGSAGTTDDRYGARAVVVVNK